MAFVDAVTIRAKAGNGGNGVVRWLRTKETARGGPSGGDGGHGGDVVLVGVRDLAALASYRFEKDFAAENGGAGKSELKRGKDGDALELPVPVGTVAILESSGDEYEITRPDEKIVILRGGRGGKGNARFKSSTHQNPFESTDGKPGEESEIKLSLKLIADVGLVGLPNAGKSSLLNALTRAKSKIGDYPFTTLEPNLGDFYGHVIADIPGLISGAAEGKGLGMKFLKHIERTGLLLHLVSSAQEDTLGAYREVRRELESFGHLLEKKEEIVVLSQVDRLTPEEIEDRMALLTKETGRTVVALSVEDEKVLKAFSDMLTKRLAEPK